MSNQPLNRQQTLSQRYQALDLRSQSIVQTFALLYEPSARNQAWQVWDAAMSQIKALPIADGKPLKSLDTQSFSAQVKRLIDQDLLSQKRAQGARCPKVLVDVVVRDAVNRGTFEPIVQEIVQRFPIRKRYGDHGPRVLRKESEFMRELRIAIYRQDRAAIDSLFEDLRHAYWRSTSTFPQVLQKILTNPFDPAWMLSLSEEFRQLGLRLILEDSVDRCVAANEAFDLLEEIYNPRTSSLDLWLIYGEQLWLRGYLNEAKTLLQQVPAKLSQAYQIKHNALLGAIAFLSHDIESSLKYYQLSIQGAGTSQRAQANWFEQSAAVLYFFVLLKIGSPDALKTAEAYTSLLRQQTYHRLQPAMKLLLAVLQTQQGRLGKVANINEDFSHYALGTSGLVSLLEIYSLHWLAVKNLADWLPGQLARLYREASQADYTWLALEIVELMGRYHKEEIYTELTVALREEVGSQSLIGAVQQQERWQLSLKALTRLTAPPAPNGAGSPLAPTYRMAWRLEYKSSSDWELLPLEQKLNAKGHWTKGKPIALKRLTAGGKRPPYLTSQDHRICDTLEIEYEQDRYYRSSRAFYFFSHQALLALVGHPYVFWEDTPNIRVEVVTGEPELRVKRLQEERLRLELAPPIIPTAEILVQKETPTRLKVIAVTPEHQHISEILGPQNRLEVPSQAQTQVLEAISAIANLVTVQSDIGGGVEAETVPVDATLRVHLLPAGEGLKVSLLVHPFSEGGGYYPPGKGGETVIAEVAGKRLQTQRDLKAEKKRAKALQVTCPVLKEYPVTQGEWLIEEPTDCLELLLQLQALDSEEVVIEWPEGEKFRVSRQLGLSDLNLNIRRQQDWFAASGDVQVSDDQVMDVQQLMALLAATPGRFIKLSEGQFVALTDEFRQRLQTLGRLTENHKQGMRIHGLAALALDEMVEDVEQLKVDKAWKSHLKKIRAAQTIDPQVPSQLQANLRDYQQAGYTWLARLAHWGVGACLADDMGLGKTLQALAVILSLSEAGPTLVIAPTSVCMNWISEAERFAPSLQVKVFGSGDRQKMLADLVPQDVLICSYGLLQQPDVADRLAQISWQTIVLDEAQAIKNSTTKRSQAAMALQGNFKLITTGTPIENHLGELWNLFRFINPGLLGSLDSFNERFAYAIERDQDDTARDALRQLIQPFILRRTKAQVLQELPPRTEITLQVELSAEEMAFYEALRREAITKLSDMDAPPGHKHLQVLAEIMRLRRACCNPSLVHPELELTSAKLTQFGEVLSELLANGHKALVFSQFVDHLSILRAYLDQQQISYQYLDGSTPAKQRKKRVDAFQQGDGVVFLISLKAGGTGLNLTAADYVIHMDPWWNPAVEDQASDRAHRIGQQRPVTIYRLVAKGTIEDKIVALHQRKRDLADSLLTGADLSSKVSTAELLALIQG